MKNQYFYYTLVLSAIFTAVFSVSIISGGIKFSSDSLQYFELAKGFITGNPLRNSEGVIITHWPPGYPFILFLISKTFSIDIITSVILLHGFLFFLLGPLSFFVAKESGLNAKWAFIFSLLLYISSPTYVFAYFLSEAISVIIFLFILFLLFRYLKTGKVLYIILIALIISSSYLIRYAFVGIGLITGVVMIYDFWANKKETKYFINALIIWIATLTSYFGWNKFLESLSASPPRSFGLHLEVIPKKIIELLFSLYNWFIIGIESFRFLLITSRLWIIIGLSILILGIYFIIVYSHCPSKFKPLFKPLKSVETLEFKTRVLLLFIIGYFGFIAITIIFFDPGVRFSHRILSLIWPVVLLLILHRLYQLSTSSSNCVRNLLLWVVVLFGTQKVLSFYLYHSNKNDIYLNEFGRVYNSGVIKFISNNHNSADYIFTNIHPIFIKFYQKLQAKNPDTVLYWKIQPLNINNELLLEQQFQAIDSLMKDQKKVWIAVDFNYLISSDLYNRFNRQFHKNKRTFSNPQKNERFMKKLEDKFSNTTEKIEFNNGFILQSKHRNSF